MAVAYITEYSKLAEDERGRTIQAGQEPRKAFQTVTFTTTTQSAAFNADTKFIRIISDTAAYIEFGANPTANTASDTLIAASTAEFFGVIGGQKVALVT